MLNFFQKKGLGPLWGLDIGTRSVKAVFVASGKGRPVLKHALVEPMPEDVIVSKEMADRQAVVETLIRMFELVPEQIPRRVVVSVAGRGILTRKMTLTREKGVSLEEAVITAVSGGQLPFDLQEVYWDFAEVGKTPEGQIQGFFVASRPPAIEEVLDVVATAELTLVGVDHDPFAVYNLYKYLSVLPPTGRYLGLHMGYELSHLFLMEDSALVWTQEIPFAQKQFVEALNRILGMDIAEAQQALRGEIPESFEEQSVRQVIANVTGNFVDNIRRILESESEERTVEGIFLSGGGALIDGLPAELENSLELQILTVNPLDYMDVEADVDPDLGPLLTVALGMAIKSLAPVAVDINLLPKEEKEALERELLPIPRPELTLPLATGVLALLVVGAGWWNRSQTLSRLRAEITDKSRQVKQLEQSLGDLAGLKKKRDLLQRKIRTIEMLRRGQTEAILYIDELVRRLPTNVWLTSLEDQGNMLSLKGGAMNQAAVAQFMRNLERSEQFADPTVPVIEEARTKELDYYEFQLSVRKTGGVQ